MNTFTTQIEFIGGSEAALVSWIWAKSDKYSLYIMWQACGKDITPFRPKLSVPF